MYDEFLDWLLTEMKQLADERSETIIDFPKYLKLIINTAKHEDEQQIVIKIVKKEDVN